MQLRPVSSLAVALCLASSGAGLAADRSELEVVYRIKREAIQNSQVMKHLFELTDVHGPRLTSSPGYESAARWIVEQAQEWGLENAALEEWGPYGRGWSTSYYSGHMLEPQYASLIGVPLAWTPGTDGVVEGVPILAPLPASMGGFGSDVDEAREDLGIWFDEWRGKLDGAIVLLSHARRLSEQASAPSRRYSSSDLQERAMATELVEPFDFDPDNPVAPEDPGDRRRFFAAMPRAVRNAMREKRTALLYDLNRFLVDEGVALTLRPGFAGDGGNIFPPRVGRHNRDAVDPPASVALTAEHYNRIVRLLGAGFEPRLQVEVRAQFHDLPAHNVVAEIPGGTKADELVIIGAHLDDVAYGTGATDNATGCAVMMEAMRILETLGLEMNRTVRMVLWSGEEEGLLGSRAYVTKHYGDARKKKLLADNARVSAYYNLDNGTGRIRGVYLQSNDMVRPIFSAWLQPFADLGAGTLSIRDTGGTDHLSFDAVGIPGFQFIQDPVEYDSRTHHSTMDVLDRVQAADMMQAAAIVASFVYHTANREEMLPRKPLDW